MVFWVLLVFVVLSTAYRWEPESSRRDEARNRWSDSSQFDLAEALGLLCPLGFRGMVNAEELIVAEQNSIHRRAFQPG